jgi:hypothetical protein
MHDRAGRDLLPRAPTDSGQFWTAGRRARHPSKTRIVDGYRTSGLPSPSNPFILPVRIGFHLHGHSALVVNPAEEKLQVCPWISAEVHKQPAMGCICLRGKSSPNVEMLQIGKPTASRIMRRKYAAQASSGRKEFVTSQLTGGYPIRFLTLHRLFWLRFWWFYSLHETSYPLHLAPRLLRA